MTEIVLRQHGDPEILSAREYHEKWAHALEVLQNHRILRVRRAGEHVLIYPNQYVGTARCAAGRIRIDAKFPDVLTQLRRRFSMHARNVYLTGYEPSAEHFLGLDRASAFLGRLELVIDLGVPFVYKARTSKSSSLNGSLNVSRTIAEFENLGIRHMAIVRRSHRTPLLELVHVVRAAIDVLHDEKLLSMAEVTRLDTLMQAFPGGTVRFTQEELFSMASWLCRDQEDRKDVVDLCAIAVELLLRSLSLDDVEYASGDVSFRFTDSDALWERAVHQALKQVADPLGFQAMLHPLRNKASPLYPNGGPNIDPDVVVYSGRSPLLVADAKDYAATSFEASGVYQVDSYARHLGAQYAALFYLSETGTWHHSFGDGTVQVISFGVTVDGTRTFQHLISACSKAVTRACT